MSVYDVRKKSVPLSVQMSKKPSLGSEPVSQLKAPLLTQSLLHIPATEPAGLVQLKENNTGLPDQLKAGVEQLSGYSLEDVRVHYNSEKPAQLQAHAFAQGTEIHVAPGQEQHLAHEAWHVVQQKQGRVQPTRQLKGQVGINDDAGLEREADVMGEKAFKIFDQDSLFSPSVKRYATSDNTIQKVTIALGSVQEIGHTKNKIDPEAAKVITNAEKDWIEANGDIRANPWEEKGIIKKGPLSDIRTDQIRIYGHGGSYDKTDFASKVGGYSPEEIVEKLKKMGLSPKYSGEIYLTGCNTASGSNKGFLGIFFKYLTKHCKSATVRGNIGEAVTSKDGQQGVWTSAFTKKEYDKAYDKLERSNKFYSGKADELKERVESAKAERESLRKEEIRIDSMSAQEKAEFDKKMNELKDEEDELSSMAGVLQELQNTVANDKKELEEIAYDKSGRLTVTLPGQDDEFKKVEEAQKEYKPKAEEKLKELKKKI